jgi:hypothetical protein
MKTLLFSALLLLLLSSCGSNKADTPAEANDSLSAAPVYSWEAVINDSTQRLEMKKIEAIGPDSLSAPAVISFLNNNNPKIKLELLKISTDTLYLKIEDAEYLTQQMGSTGPTMYFATAVYNLTEVPGIKYVNFDFAEGDHAQPDTFGRDNFKDE